jgi:hypothetical protein
VVDTNVEAVDEMKVVSLIRLQYNVDSVWRGRILSLIGFVCRTHVHRISQKSVGLVQVIDGQDVQVMFGLMYGWVSLEQLIVIVE